MPLKIESIFSNTLEAASGNYKTRPSDFWVMVSGVTPGSMLQAGVRQSVTTFNALNYSVVTVPYGFAVGSSTSRALLPINTGRVGDLYEGGANLLSNATLGLVIKDVSTLEFAVVSGPMAATTVASEWSITQDSARNCNITCTSMGSGGQIPYVLNLNMALQSSVTLQGVPTPFAVELLSPTGSSVFSQNVPLPADGSLPFIQVPSASITTTGNYTVYIKSRYAKPDASVVNYYPVMVQYKYLAIPTVLTAPSTASGSTATLYSWLTNDYYYLTDLQVNLDTRAVTHRHGTVALRPNDTVNFAILFNNGASGVDPVATDIRIAVRGSSNSGPYALWSAATVTTVAVSGDTYYSITMTASDEDLLSIQAKNILSGSSGQSLVGEIEWTTSRGTFSSNTFTINMPTQVAREPDV
jgi:hypothetical protein